MRRIVCMVALLLIAGCGSSDPSPLFGGFTPTSGAAVILEPATCSIPMVGTTSISGILVELTSGGPGACDILTASKQCGTGANSTTVLLGALSGAVGGSVGAAGPGTYTVFADPPTGEFLAAMGAAAQVDASCVGSSPDLSGGSITISSVSTTAVAGSINVSFENGQVFKQSFDVEICPVTIDVCSLFGTCSSHPCVQ